MFSSHFGTMYWIQTYKQWISTARSLIFFFFLKETKEHSGWEMSNLWNLFSPRQKHKVAFCKMVKALYRRYHAVLIYAFVEISLLCIFSPPLLFLFFLLFFFFSLFSLAFLFSPSLSSLVSPLSSFSTLSSDLHLLKNAFHSMKHFTIPRNNSKIKDCKITMKILSEWVNLM